MLRPRQQYRILMTAVAFAIIGLAFFAGSAGIRSQRADPHQRTNSDTNAAKHGQESTPHRDKSEAAPQEDHAHKPHDWGSPEAWLVYLTAFLVLGTIFLARYTYNLWQETRELALDAKETSKRQLRAFVFPTGLSEFWEYGPVAGRYYWRLRPVWQNSGDTPTKGLSIYSACEIRNTRLPPGFDFTQVSFPAGSGLLGPRSSNMGGAAPHMTLPPISPQDLYDAQQGIKFIYLWGWARYNDVFPGTPSHITRFCWQIFTVGNPFNCVPGTAIGRPGALSFSYVHMNEGNCADEECDS